MDIKKVNYNRYECEGNSDVVCPYCEFKNDTADLDEYSEDEKFEYECEQCGRVFMAHPHYSVSYDSEPFENYYIDRVEQLEKEIKCYENPLFDSRQKKGMLKLLTDDLINFETKSMAILRGQ